MNKDYKQAVAKEVEKQADELPGIGVPVDPEIAEEMGCFFDPEEEEMLVAILEDSLESDGGQ